MRPMARGEHTDVRESIDDYSAAQLKLMEAELDVLTFTQQVYKPSSEDLQSWIKTLWYQ